MPNHDGHEQRQVQETLGGHWIFYFIGTLAIIVIMALTIKPTTAGWAIIFLGLILTFGTMRWIENQGDR